MTTYSWNVNASGDWSTAADWSPSGPPTAGASIVLDSAALHTVTISTGAISVDNILAEDDNLTITGGSMAITGTGTFADALTLGSGLFLSFTGTGTSTVSGAFKDSGNIEVAGTLVLDGNATIEQYALFDGLGTLEFGGIATIGSYSTLDVSRIKLLKGADVTVNNGVSIDAPFTEAAGATLVVAATDRNFISTNTIAGTVTGNGEWSTSKATIEAGASITVAKWIVGTLTLDENLTYSGAFIDDSASLGANTLTLTGGAAFGAGEITGTGSLVFAGGIVSLVNAPEIAVSNWTVSGGETLVNTPLLSFVGTFSEGTGGTIDIESVRELQLSGTSTIAGVIEGNGALDFRGGSATLASGANLLVETVTVNGGTVAFGENDTYAGDLTFSSGTLALNADTLTLTGTATIDGTVSGTGELKIGAGSTTFGAGTTLSVSNWDITAGIATIASDLSYGGALSETGGAISIATGEALTLTGTSTLTCAVTGEGTLALSGGSTTFSGAATLTTSDWTMSSKAAVAINKELSYAGNLTEAAGTAITLGTSEYLSLSGVSDIAGTIGGGGTLILAGGSTTIASGAAITMSRWTIESGTTVALNTSLSYSGALADKAGTDLDIGSGDELVLSTGSDTFGGTISGYGSLHISVGFDTLLAGAAITVSSWDIAAKAGVTVDGNLTYAGDLDVVAGGFFTSDETLVLTGVLTLSGELRGAQANFIDGTYNIETGSTLGVAKWDVLGSSIVNIHGNGDYYGTFDSLGGTTFDIASDSVLELEGDSTIAGVFEGSGILGTSAPAIADGITLESDVTWMNYSTVTQKQQTILDGASTLLDNYSGAVFDIIGNTGISTGSTAANLINAGTFEKTGGTGTSAIAVGVTNTGLIEVTTGTLDFMRAVSGAGTLEIAGAATMEFGAVVASGQKLEFSGTGGDLMLSDPALFDAGISDFTAGDKIDLVNFSKATSVSFTEASGNTEGVLTIAEGSDTVKLILFGQFVTSGFSIASDGGGGTLITYVPPASASAAAQLAGNHHG